jgi:hypothetical protein
MACSGIPNCRRWSNTRKRYCHHCAAPAHALLPQFGVGVGVARQMLGVGVALLDAGGMAVKVESSGIAHSGARWRELATSDDPFDHYTAFVTLIGRADCFYSCGMHSFGLPDSAVPRDIDIQEAAQLLNVFNRYLLVQSPALVDGHTFSVAADAPCFRLRKTDATPTHQTILSTTLLGYGN